jgi:Na+-transporting NADH:ubiquinone oxidoreductase subunit A
MALHTVKKGLDLPISGEPVQRIEAGQPVSRVAITAEDYIGLKPTMFVEVGAEVLRGQTLMEDKKNPGVVYTAPGAGRVVAVNRGKKRVLQSIVIELNERERTNSPATRTSLPSRRTRGTMSPSCRVRIFRPS